MYSLQNQETYYIQIAFWKIKNQITKCFPIFWLFSKNSTLVSIPARKKMNMKASRQVVMINEISGAHI